MTEVLKKYSRASSFGAFAAAPMYPGAPRIAFAPANEGTGGSDDGAGDDADAKAAADKAAADKAAADKAEADRLAAEKSGDDKDKDRGLLREVMEKKGEIKTLKDQLAKFEGIDPDAVRALIEEKRNAELAAEEAKGNFARVKEMMAEEHAKDKKSLSDQIADLQKQLAEKDGTINDLTVGRSFSESKFIGEDLVLPRAKARAIYSSHFEVVDGKIVGYDKPASAKDRTQIVDAAGQPVSFDEAIKRIIDADPEKDSLYRDKAKAGAGSASAKIEAPKDKKEEKGLFGAARILAGLNATK
ncbi:hypothetical protein HJB53_30455 [Rhizobium lentis]|uniref:DUF6651 domain-containing protein n=1 Tax=Rhizobium lentis TaxID=1138194 RepID=UPI001C82DFAC|nr:DUF6651 domain-containing protein [Rhizobium lentis]MBX5130815.1 hypothetical protein [Rhizobium lentis]